MWSAPCLFLCREKTIYLMSPETKPVVHFSGSPRTERIEAGKLGLKMSYAVASIELCQEGRDRR